MYNTDCDCVGPQNGEPYCYCQMKEREVYEEKGFWVDPSQGNKILGEIEADTVDD